MTALLQDRLLLEDVIAQRKEAGADRWDEVWDGVYILMPLPNDEHQEIVTSLASVLQFLIGFPGRGHVRAGVNVSDRDDDWTKNYRCPDVAVFLPETKASNHDTYWLGGPDFAVEILSPDDLTRDKLPFYAQVGTREMLLIDRDPWALELYRLREGRLGLVGRSTVEQPETLASEVLPLRFRLVAGEERPQIEVTQAEDAQSWLV